jgi:hypothetical protein
MTGWNRVQEELDIWAAQKRTAKFWWRDDDAQDVSVGLKRLLATAREFEVCVALSVIPSGLKAGLVRHISPLNHVQVLVHGFAHKNHARHGTAKRELGGARALSEIVHDLAMGMKLAREAFGERLLPVIVPPWNRITSRAVAPLPGLGYRGLSTWKPRLKAQPCPGLIQVNAHLDIVDWRRGRAIKDEELVAGLLLRKLRWRRANPLRASEPLGLLTHHKLWSAEKEKIVKKLLAVTRGHPAVVWHTASEAFEL